MPLKRKQIVDITDESQSIHLFGSSLVKKKVADFARFVDQISSEAEDKQAELEKARADLKECEEALHVSNSTVSSYENMFKINQSTISTLNKKLKATEDEKSNADEKILTISNELAAVKKSEQILKSEVQLLKTTETLLREELERSNNLQESMMTKAKEQDSLLDGARKQLEDYITLQSSSSAILTTSGQVTSLEGLIQTWINTPSFNGEVAYPIKCPMTKRMVWPVDNKGVLNFTQRIATSLGLSPNPPLHFRYNAHNDGRVSWQVYPLADQLAIAAKVVHMYNNPVTDSTFSICVKGTHILFGTCSVGPDEVLDISLFVTINSVDGPKDHAVELFIEPGTTNPFYYARFG